MLFCLGVAICAYVGLANLQEYPCSGTCVLVTTGNSTHVVCPNVPNCNYAGFPASTVLDSGVLLAVVGAIIATAGVVEWSRPK